MLKRVLAVLVGLSSTPATTADIADLLGGTTGVLSPQQAFAPQLVAGVDGMLELRFTIAAGHYLYRDRLAVVGPDGAELVLALPPGESYDDPEFGRLAVLRGAPRIPLGIPARPGTRIDLRYQGCAEGRLCYAPVRVPLQLP